MRGSLKGVQARVVRLVADMQCQSDEVDDYEIVRILQAARHRPARPRRTDEENGAVRRRLWKLRREGRL